MAEARSPWIAVGALNAAIAVAAGAFAAHGLRGKLEPRALEVFETGARYHMYHALALVLAGIIATWGSASGLTARATDGAHTAGWLIQGGIVLFCGSLYALALTGIAALGAITPLGGVAFLAGWLWLAWTSWRR